MCIAAAASADRASGAMDNASDYGSEDSRFDSWLARSALWGTRADLVADSVAMVLPRVFCASSPKANAPQPFGEQRCLVTSPCYQSFLTSTPLKVTTQGKSIFSPFKLLSKHDLFFSSKKCKGLMFEKWLGENPDVSVLFLLAFCLFTASG